MIYQFGSFQVDDADFRLSSEGSPIALEPKTLRLLLFLLQNSGRLVRKQELLDAVWPDTAVSENALTRSIGLLRRALDDPSREPRFIETVPTVGYRFIAPVVTSAATPPSTSDAPSHAPSGIIADHPSTQPASLPQLRTASALALLAAFASLFLYHLVSRQTAKNQIHSLAVLPLENLSGNPAEEYFADGITDELITELARIPTLRVVSRTSVMQDKGARKSLVQIAKELDVDAIVEGSIVRSGDRVRITAQLIDARTDRHLWAQTFEGRSTDILSLQDSLTTQIAEETRVALVPKQTPRREIAPDAHDAYLRGRYFFQKDDFLRSAASFRKAIALEPAYASAYAGLADALDAQTTFGMADPVQAMPQAIAASQHAIQLDPRNGEAYAALGSIQTIYLWDWREAERNIARAIALSPSYPLAEMKYAALLDALGRPDEAVSHMRRALSLDPLSFFMNRRLAATLYLARDYDQAITQFSRALELEPEHSLAAAEYQCRIFALKGMHDQAVEFDLRSLSQQDVTLDTSAIQSAYQHRGWTAYLVARIRAFNPHAGQGCVPYQQAVDLLQLGDLDRAFESLNRALDQHCYRMTWAQVDPMLDPIRHDPRYTQLLHRLNLPS